MCIFSWLCYQILVYLCNSFNRVSSSDAIQWHGHDDVIKWKHFPRKWPFVRGINRSRWIPQHKGQWRGALMFSLICVWINGWVNNLDASDLRRHRGHYDVIVMLVLVSRYSSQCWRPGVFTGGNSVEMLKTPIIRICCHLTITAIFLRGE